MKLFDCEIHPVGLRASPERRALVGAATINGGNPVVERGNKKLHRPFALEGLGFNELRSEGKCK